MVFDIYDRTGDMNFVKKSLPALLKEYEFWNSGIDDYRSPPPLPYPLPSKTVALLLIYFSASQNNVFVF
jgi:hypothetical protein